ncbi:amidohydrolase family protein [Sphingomonas sp. HF-S3]|uniref:Amidohydrolase family protein n=1 Tax=Sphingomonas rustica TaxID=3103142 RepID=A0ABV0BCM9_9SPHN
MKRLFLALAAALTCIGAAPAERATLIHGARVFDGSGRPAQVRDVLIRGDRIVQVGTHLKVPDAEIVEGGGMTLIPGLHDLHIHTPGEYFGSADAIATGYGPYLAAGVTSVNEFSVGPEMLAPIRSLSAPLPHLSLALRLGVPHGHGTESDFTNGITAQVTTPEAARTEMARLLPYKPDVIKVFTDGWRYGRDADRPSMDLLTLTAIVEAAHAQGVPVVTHTVTLAGAKIAARAGVDALAHGIGDLPADAELIALMKRHRTAYVPTMAVYEPQQDRRFLNDEWVRLRPQDRAREETRLARPIEPVPDFAAKRWSILQQNLRILHKAGIPIATGTDTGIGGVYPGIALIREIRLFVSLGFTPAEALRASTATSAAIMGKSRTHGRILPGQRADLVLIGGMPDRRIEDIYQVRRVWVSGEEVTLPAR